MIRTTLCFSRKLATLLIAGATLFFLSVPEAEAVPISGSFVVQSKDASISTIAVGDKFIIQFDINDTVTDTSASVGVGSFPSLATSFSITADAGNIGSWDGTGTGTYVPGSSNFVTNAFGNNATFQPRGAGFLSSGTDPFHDVDVSFGGFSPVIMDSGLGDAFKDQFGGSFDPAATTFTSVAIRFDDGLLGFPSASLQGNFAVVPEPSTMVLLGSGLAGLGFLRRRRKTI